MKNSADKYKSYRTSGKYNEKQKRMQKIWYFVLTFYRKQCYNNSRWMRECWNWQTGTFEGRVSMTYEFKSRLAHQIWNPETRMNGGFWGFFFIFDQQIDQQFYKIDQRYGMIVFWVLSKYIRERFTVNCNRTGGRQGENGGCVRKSYRLRFQWFVQSLKEPLRICSSRF